MRMLIAAVLLFATVLAAPAAEWGHYANERFGVAADVPPGFVAGAPPANGDGLGFSTPTARLSIFGSLIVEGDFESEVSNRIDWAEAEGWAITYRSTGPDWATWSGRRGSRILYARAIPLCDGTILGAFEFEYSQVDRAQFDPIVERLSSSLGDSGDGWQC